MITLKNVYKAFGEKQVLKDFSLQIPKGERVCLMGASGSGKTTLFNLILGLEKPDSGEVVLGGKCSAVFQEDRLCEDFSALSNVKMVMPGREENLAQKVLKALLDESELNAPVRTFSGGMKRRVAIARALCFKSDILLLDEPFTGLDDETKVRAAAAINAESEGKTILLISHDSEDAKLLGAKIIELK